MAFVYQEIKRLLTYLLTYLLTSEVLNRSLGSFYLSTLS